VKQALKYAMDTGELPRNEATKAKLPKFDAKAEAEDEDDDVVKSLTADQEFRFLEAALDDRLSPLWYLMLNTGLRPGEAFALKWENVDFDAMLMKVRGTLVRVGVDKAEKGWVIRRPKTKRSKREVPINPMTRWLLLKWKQQ